MWDVVCDHWNVGKYCMSDRQGDLEFTAHIASMEPQINHDCLFFMIQRGVFADGTESPLYCPHKNQTQGRYFNASCEAVCDKPAVVELITKQKIPNSEVR